MTAEQASENDPRMEQALAELKGLIQHRYPSAQFSVFRGDDPVGLYLKATVDVDDTDKVVDVFIDRLIDLQVEEQLPIYVVTSQPIERVLEEIRAANPPRRYRALGGPSLNP